MNVELVRVPKEPSSPVAVHVKSTVAPVVLGAAANTEMAEGNPKSQFVLLPMLTLGENVWITSPGVAFDELTFTLETEWVVLFKNHWPVPLDFKVARLDAVPLMDKTEIVAVEVALK